MSQMGCCNSKKIKQDYFFVFQIPPTTNARGKPVGERKYHLETFNTDITSKALPLAYTFERQNSNSTNTLPNNLKICDFKDCTVNTTESAIRLSCFHTIHLSCYNMANNQCPICTKPLLDEMKKLSQSFNQSLLEPTKPSTSPSTTNTNESPDDEEEVTVNCNSNEAIYYQSEAWQRKINDTLDSFTVPQPQHAQPVQPQQQTSPPPQHQSVNTPVFRPNILKMAFGSSIIWFFPYQFSQSTLFGRNGSNACTFIALLVSKFYFVNKSVLTLNQHNSLPPAWINLMINSMSLGNQIYDKITQGSGQYYSVDNAIRFLPDITGNVELEDSLDLSIINENPAVPQSSLGFYLPRLTQEDNLAAIVIMNGKTICLVGRDNNILIMDSHLHGQLGAMIGIATVDKAEELLFFIKQQLSLSFNICSLTFVKY